MSTPITATELRSFYAGLILSDGSIDKGVSKRSYTQKTINQDFADYIIDFTQQYTNFPTSKRYVQARIDKNGVNHKEHWNLRIGAHPYFSKLYHLFYDDYRVKYINPKVLNWLDLRGLANWYMSDGYITNVGKTKGNVVDSRIEICTDSFPLEQVEMFCSWLTDFGYKTRPIKRGSLYRARMSLFDGQRFLVDIEKYVVPSMRYKLFLGVDREWFSSEYKKLKSDILVQGLAQKQV